MMPLVIQADRLGQFAGGQGVAHDAQLLEQRDGVGADVAQRAAVSGYCHVKLYGPNYAAMMQRVLCCTWPFKLVGRHHLAGRSD